MQTQLSQFSSKFNGISLFSSDAAVSSTSPKPELNVETGTYDYVDHNGDIQSYTNLVGRAGRTLYTHPSGLSEDGSISINVTNLQFLLTLNNTTTLPFPI